MNKCRIVTTGKVAIGMLFCNLKVVRHCASFPGLFLAKFVQHMRGHCYFLAYDQNSDRAISIRRPKFPVWYRKWYR